MTEEEIQQTDSLVYTEPEEVLQEGTIIDEEATLESGVNYDVNFAGTPQKDIGSSTDTDYWDTLNPLAVQTNHPETQINRATDSGILDVDSPEFKEVFSNSNIETKSEMLNASSTEMAIKVAQRRTIFNDASERIAQDSLMEQLGSGLAPSLFSPSNLLPFGAVYKSAQVANLAGRVLAVGGVGGTAGAIANIADEALFDAQGMPTNYVSSAAYGFGFGFGLGALGGALSGPRKTNVANAIDPKQDTLARDMDTDNLFVLEYDENGVAKINLTEPAQMSKSLIDRIPLIGNLLKSDVHIVMQGKDGILRSLMMRIASPSIAQKDAAGNMFPAKKNGWDTRIEAKGIHNAMVEELTQSYNSAKEGGYKGNREDFNKDIWTSYTEAMTTQRNQASAHAAEITTDVQTQIKTERQAELSKVDEDLLYYRNEEGKVVPMTEELVGKIPEDKLVIKKDTKASRAKLKEEVNTKYDQKLEDELKAVEDEWYTTNITEFKGTDGTIKGAQAYQKYFQKMLKKSQDLKIEGVTGIHNNKIYLPRTYDYKKIQNGSITDDVLLSEIKAGIQNDYRNVNLHGEDLDTMARDIANMLKESSFNIQNLTSTFLAKDLPFGARLKQRKLYLNESYMPTILRTNMDDVVGAYHYGMAGRQGVQYAFGTDKLDEIIRMTNDEHISRGTIPNAKDMAAFERSLNDLLGTLRMNQFSNTPRWEWTRNLLSFNSARLMGGAGGNQFIELAGAIVMNGTKALMSGRIIKSFTNAADLLYKQGGGHDKFSQYLIASGHMEEALHSTRINRLTDAESGFNSGWLENKLNWMNDKLMKYNGMRYFMGVMEDMTGGAVVTKLTEGGFSTKDLARMGLSPEDVTSLSKALKDITLEDWDISKLSDKHADQLQLAISRGIEDIVVQGESIHLPAWMKDLGPMGKLMTQFMRFPLIAQETLLRRGMSDNQAQMVGGMAASMTAYIGLKYLREQAAIATGVVHSVDAKYDITAFDDDDWFRVTGEGMNYMANLGMMGNVANYGRMMTGSPQIGRDWADNKIVPQLVGPTGGLAENLFKLTKGMVSGDVTSEKGLKNARNLLMFGNLPLVKEGLDYLAEDIGD